MAKQVRKFVYAWRCFCFHYYPAALCQFTLLSVARILTASASAVAAAQNL